MLGGKLEPGVKQEGDRDKFLQIPRECVMVVCICAILFFPIMFKYLV